MANANPFRYFRTSPEIIRLAVMMHVRFPFSLRNVEDLLHERGIGVSYESVRFRWHRFGPVFAAEIRRKLIPQLHAYSNWQWHQTGLLLLGHMEGFAPPLTATLPGEKIMRLELQRFGTVPK